MKIGVAMLDFGGPRGPDELVPFLTELLTDVLPGPLALKRWIAPALARSRAGVVGPNYAEIGWSPLVDTHHRQIAALRQRLAPELPMASGMMFTPPTMDSAVKALLDQEVEAIVAISLFPHFSLATTNTAFSFFFEALERAGRADLPVHWVPAYFDHPDYIEALAGTIRAGIEATPGDGELHLVFSPHGLPLSFVHRGDPYPDHIRESIRRVIAHLDWTGPWHLGWQSRVGPVKWLSPGTPEVLTTLAGQGARRVCLVPISFASDHIETLHEIDIEYAAHAHAAGITHFGRAPALGEHPAFIRCLAERIEDAFAHMNRYRCVRCLHPKSDAHRRRKTCRACRFSLPDYLRSGRAPGSVPDGGT